MKVSTKAGRTAEEARTINMDRKPPVPINQNFENDGLKNLCNGADYESGLAWLVVDRFVFSRFWQAPLQFSVLTCKAIVGSVFFLC